MIDCILAALIIGIMTGLCIYIVLFSAGNYVAGNKPADPAPIVLQLTGLCTFLFGGTWGAEKFVPSVQIQANLNVYLAILATLIMLFAAQPTYLLVKICSKQISRTGS